MQFFPVRIDHYISVVIRLGRATETERRRNAQVEALELRSRNGASGIQRSEAGILIGPQRGATCHSCSSKWLNEAAYAMQAIRKKRLDHKQYDDVPEVRGRVTRDNTLRAAAEKATDGDKTENTTGQEFSTRLNALSGGRQL
jgi:hypothetical protein